MWFSFFVLDSYFAFFGVSHNGRMFFLKLIWDWAKRVWRFFWGFVRGLLKLIDDCFEIFLGLALAIFFGVIVCFASPLLFSFNFMGFAKKWLVLRFNLNFFGAIDSAYEVVYSVIHAVLVVDGMIRKTILFTKKWANIIADKWLVIENKGVAEFNGPFIFLYKKFVLWRVRNLDFRAWYFGKALPAKMLLDAEKKIAEKRRLKKEKSDARKKIGIFRLATQFFFQKLADLEAVAQRETYYFFFIFIPKVYFFVNIFALPAWRDIYFEWPIYQWYRANKLARERWLNGVEDSYIDSRAEFNEFLAIVINKIENIPERLPIIINRRYLRVKGFFLEYASVRFVVKWVKAFLKVYFFFVNFRRIVVVGIIIDLFFYRWSDFYISWYLQIWYVTLDFIGAQVLWILMDAADKLVTINSHDFFTRRYLKYFKPNDVIKKRLTPAQMEYKFIYWWTKLRDKRNMIIALVGFVYLWDPIFKQPSPYK